MMAQAQQPQSTCCNCHCPTFLTFSPLLQSTYLQSQSNVTTTWKRPRPDSPPSKPPYIHPPRRSAIPPTALFFRRNNNNAPKRLFTSPKPPSHNHPPVTITAPTQDSRVITSSIVIQSPTSIVFDTLADYNNLANIVPNLAVSQVVGEQPQYNAVVLEQKGVQKILGFQFAASVRLRMRKRERREITFDLVDSRDFKKFNGRWSLTEHQLPAKASRKGTQNGGVNGNSSVNEMGENETATVLSYDVTVSPRGFVPVKAIEWRISEDVPGNMMALKRHCETLWRRTLRRKSMEELQQQNANANGNGKTNGNGVVDKKEQQVDSARTER